MKHRITILLFFLILRFAPATSCAIGCHEHPIKRPARQEFYFPSSDFDAQDFMGTSSERRG